MRISDANRLFQDGGYREALLSYQRLSGLDSFYANMLHVNIQLCVNRIKSQFYKSQSVSDGNLPCVSVIIPCHNVGIYIEKCLSSLPKDSEKFTLEIIIIDDGSTDNTVEILKNAAKEDSRIKLILNSKGSGNSGTPRNQGLRIARGHYIAFLDSDDWIDEGMYEELYALAAASDSDIASSGGFYRESGESTEVVKVVNETIVECDDADKGRVLCSMHFPIAWFRIYKRSLLELNLIEFGETRTSADIVFSFQALCLAKNIITTNKIFYHYRFDRPDSTTFRRKGAGAFDLFISYTKILEFLSNSGLRSKYISHIVLKLLGDYHYNKRFLIDGLHGEFRLAAERFIRLIDKHEIDLSLFSEGNRNFLCSLFESSTKSGETKPLSTAEESGSAVDVSIIMPSHNSAQYVAKSLQSIIDHVKCSYEILIIDDGSSDETVSVVKQIARDHPGVNLICCSHPSGDPGTPRSVGLCAARGRYIGFVDSDDWLEGDMYSNLIADADREDADIALASSFVRVSLDLDEVKEIKLGWLFNKDQSVIAHLRNPYLSTIWYKIYRRSFIKKNKIFFPRVYLGEDRWFGFVTHILARKIYVSKHSSHYHYRHDRPDSTTDIRKGKKAFELLSKKQHTTIRDYFYSHGVDKEWERWAFYITTTQLLHHFKNLHDDLKEDFRKLLLPMLRPIENPEFKSLFDSSQLKFVDQISCT